ncbi:hypothetical protein N0V93_006809 [Gnomoniopsis smithogilvyi]|uniref:Uncharacterized protein n=1 Tax=Gnomoniopsis smithogilvyi TaxID=1191159 RepID=A0A9W8YQE6_9PEZI|nr:hypothetical protein N0V93_006809 [Gnomoniopsis smithogilvyi]
MSSPSTDGLSTASIEPTQFLSIHVSKAPAVVSWSDDQGQSHCLSHDPSGNDHVTLDIQCDSQNNTALFKIIANVAYKGKRNRSNIYLHIYPERLRSLFIISNEGTAPARLGTSVYTLELVLSAPASLVVPKGDWVPKNEAAQSTLASLEAVSSQTSFCVAFPSKSIAMDRLVALCEKVSVNGSLKTMYEAANITKLYGGMGGKIVEHAHKQPVVQSGSSQDKDTESPPAYGDVGDSPPLHPSHDKKRRRLNSDGSIEDASHEKLSLEDICRHGFAEIGRRFDRIERSLSNLTSRLDQVEELVRKGRPENHQEPITLGERIDSVEERVIGVEKNLQIGLSGLAQDVENQMHDVRHEFNETIMVRVDDEVGVAQSQLEDFVKDELRNAAFEVEEVVREKLKDALS